MNIIVIVSDTFRRDNLTEETPVETPNLNDFASRATVFNKCYISSFPTIPHRTDLLSGRYSFPWHGWKPLDPEIPIISSWLRENGYLGQLIADTPHLMKENYYFDRSLHASKWIRGQESDWEFTRFNQPLEEVVPDEKTRREGYKDTGFNPPSEYKWHNSEWTWEEDHLCARVARSASKWLDLNYKRGDFFLWIDMFDPHEPWDPPEYFVKRYDGDYEGVPMIHPNYGPASEYTGEELQNMRAHYYGEVTLVDKWIGYILEKIEEVGLMDDTMIVFTSDHGIYVGEHDRTAKSNIHPQDERYWPLYEELTRVPLMIYHPQGKRGEEIDQLVQPVDISATILDQAGVRLDSDGEVHGRSLLPIVTAEKERGIREYAFSSGNLNVDQKNKHTIWPTVTNDEWSYLTLGSEGEAELYHLKEDPGQEENLIEGNRAQARKMHAALVEWLKEIEAPERSIENMRSISP